VHHDLPLARQPRAEAAARGLAGLFELQAGDEEVPGRVAPHAEAQPFDRHAVQAQLAVRQRAPGDHVLDRRQHQHLAPLRVVDPHVGQADVRPQAEPSGLDRADLDRQADAARHGGDDVFAVTFDVGQHPEAQGEHQRREGEKSAPREHFDRSQQPLHGGVTSRRPF